MKKLLGYALLLIVVIVAALSVKDYIALKKGKTHPPVSSAGYVNPVGAGLKPYRIDMGVDYGGTGPVYALGAGTIVNLYNSGWPGGAFIGLRLSSGKDAGKYVYYAEDIRVAVHVNDHVHAGERLGDAESCPRGWPSCGIEIGWGAPPGHGEAMAAVTGQDKPGLDASCHTTAADYEGGFNLGSGCDPGYYPTRYGADMSDLIKSLGGPAGFTYGRPVKG